MHFGVLMSSFQLLNLALIMPFSFIFHECYYIQDCYKSMLWDYHYKLWCYDWRSPWCYVVLCVNHPQSWSGYFSYSMIFASFTVLCVSFSQKWRISLLELSCWFELPHSSNLHLLICLLIFVDKWWYGRVKHSLPPLPNNINLKTPPQCPPG